MAETSGRIYADLDCDGTKDAGEEFVDQTGGTGFQSIIFSNCKFTGASHDTSEGNNRVLVSGISKERVGQVSSEIRSFRPPEPYKGKGVKSEEEKIRRKVGKSGIK